MALLAMKKEKALNGQIISATVGNWVVAVLALFFGKPTMGFIEWVSIASTVAGVVLWQRTGNAILAIICSQVAVFAGAIPTLVGAYREPNQEDPLAWSIWFISCICVLFAVRKWNLANASQPITATFINGTMAFLVVIRPLWV
jgi:drug/metabolite transporter (DMT)-like permease